MWSIEEVPRGEKEVLVISKDFTAMGSIEVDTYEEKVAWHKALEVVNSTLTKLQGS